MICYGILAPCQVPHVEVHISGATCRGPHVRFHMSGSTCRGPHVGFHMSGVTSDCSELNLF